MNMPRHAFPLASLLGAALLMLGGCASQAQHPGAKQPPLAPPPEYHQLSTQPAPAASQQAAQPQPPALPNQQGGGSVKATVPSSVGEITPAPGQGFLPGIKQQQQAKGKPNAQLPFEKQLQDRDKRIKMGLEGTKQQSAPVGNLIESGF